MQCVRAHFSLWFCNVWHSTLIHFFLFFIDLAHFIHFASNTRSFSVNIFICLHFFQILQLNERDMDEKYKVNRHWNELPSNNMRQLLELLQHCFENRMLTSNSILRIQRPSNPMGYQTNFVSDFVKQQTGEKTYIHKPYVELNCEIYQENFICITKRMLEFAQMPVQIRNQLN